MKSAPTGKIAVFDSGVGGLTVLEHIRKALPEYDVLYFGDTARTPYGGRDPSTITHFTEQGVNFLFDQGATLVILACNTACSVALRYLQQKYLRDPGVTDRKILGIVIPTAEAADSLSTARHIGLLATQATVASKTYEEEIAKIAPDIQVHSIASPLLVPIVEEGLQDTEIARLACERYLSNLPLATIDALLLGCTHYPYLKKQIEALVPSTVRVIEQGPIVAKKTTDYLKRHPEIEKLLVKNGMTTFYCSGETASFIGSAKRYYSENVFDVRRVSETPSRTLQIDHS